MSQQFFRLNLSNQTKVTKAFENVLKETNRRSFHLSIANIHNGALSSVDGVTGSG